MLECWSRHLIWKIGRRAVREEVAAFNHARNGVTLESRDVVTP